MLEVKKVNYKYTNTTNERVLFKNLNISFEEGKFYVILGESGSGKTTFLKVIGGQINDYEGEVSYNGIEIKKIGLDEYKSKHIGFVFQEYNLLMSFSAVENIEIAMDISKQKINRKEIYVLLEYFGINKEKADRKVSTLSGGEQQRVAIARAIARDNDILIADEPTGSLDSKTGNEIIKIMKKVVRDKNKTLIMVTHNSEIAKEADEIYIMNQIMQTMEKSEAI